jgi:hypothetical protein
VDSSISVICYVTGAITASSFLHFLAPQRALKLLNKIDLDDEGGLFFVRHWGLVVTMLGCLIMWAGYDPAIRVPVLVAATIGKTAFATNDRDEHQEVHPGP